jgi:hypothetical protein
MAKTAFKKIFKWFFAYLCLIRIIGQNRQKFKVHKKSRNNVKKLIIMLIQFKFGHIQHRPYPRWLPLLKIEISSNGQNCSILSQNVPKFELYKHNNELFNIYDDIFYVLWTFADLKFGWNWPSGF